MRGRTALAAVGVVAVLVLTGQLIVQASEVAGTPGAASGGGTPAVPGAPDPGTVTVPSIDPARSPTGPPRVPTPAASSAAPAPPVSSARQPALAEGQRCPDLLTGFS